MIDVDVIVLDQTSRRVSGLEALDEVLAERVNGGNHFMIAVAGAAYPLLDVLVQDDWAAVHYFADAGLSAQAVPTSPGPGGEIAFPHSAEGDDVVLSGAVVVDVETAMRCAREFAETNRRPTTSDWTDL